MVRGFHQWLVGTGCHQEAVALGQVRTMCEDTEIQGHRGMVGVTVVGGVGLEVTLFCR